MFDVGFFELLLIGIVALLVVGPERLPKLARTAGKWVGRGRRFVNSVKDDIDREIKADELREILNKQKQSNPLHQIVEDTKKDFAQIKADTESAVDTGGKAGLDSKK
jgi:sec-independent protein translocase protein TatB